MAGLCGLGLTATSVHAEDAYVLYQVRAGDTLYTLGAAYLRQPDSYAVVQRDNAIKRVRRLQPGQMLRIRHDLLKTQPIVGEIAAATGTVWIEDVQGRRRAERGAAVGEAARVVTEAASFATLELPDESQLTLPPASRLTIEALHDDLLSGAAHRAFFLERGRTMIRVTPMRNPASQFRLRTPISVAAVRGTEYRVSSHEGTESTAEVLVGVVGVAALSPGGLAKGPETAVPAAFGVKAVAGGVSSPIPLLEPPELVDGARRQQGTSVRFVPKPLAGAVAYRAQLARDAGFVDVIAEQTAAEVLDFGPHEDGFYFVRVTGLDAAGLEGRPRTYGFERDLNVLGAVAPESVTSADGRPRLRFRWTAAGQGVKTFRFQLARSADFSAPLVDVPGLAEPELRIGKPAPGVYFWRISTTRVKGGKLDQTPGEPQELEIGE